MRNLKAWTVFICFCFLVDLRTLEELVSEGSRINLTLPKLKSLRARATAARSLGERIRAGVPIGRPRMPDQQPLTLEHIAAFRTEVIPHSNGQRTLL